MHEPEFARRKKKKFNIELANREAELMLKTELCVVSGYRFRGAKSQGSVVGGEGRAVSRLGFLARTLGLRFLPGSHSAKQICVPSGPALILGWACRSHPTHSGVFCTASAVTF